MPEQSLDNKEKQELENSQLTQTQDSNKTDFNAMLKQFSDMMDQKLSERDKAIKADFESYKRFLNDDTKSQRQKTEKLEKFIAKFESTDEEPEKKQEKPVNEEKIDKEELRKSILQEERTRKRMLQADFFDKITDLRDGQIMLKDKNFFANNWDDDSYETKLNEYLEKAKKDASTEDKDENNVKKSPNQPSPNSSRWTKDQQSEIDAAKATIGSKTASMVEKAKARELLNKYYPVY